MQKNNSYTNRYPTPGLFSRMGYKVFLCMAMAMLLMQVSCIKDELKNNECDILSAWVEGEGMEDHFYEKSQMRIERVLTNSTDIIFTVKSLLSLPQMPVNFTITPGATISPANGTPQDFSKGPVIYTVTSEDGEWSKQYKVEFREADLPTFKFSFEHVDQQTYSNGAVFDVFYEVLSSGDRRDYWASGNEGVAILHSDWTPEKFPTHSIVDGYQGKGVCLNTQDTGIFGRMTGKPIAAGNLFLGKFNFEAVLTNPLHATEFGISIDKEPVRVTGYYKYQPGEVFTDKDMNEVEGRTDEASIYAVFYRNLDENGNKVMLYGDDVLTSKYIVNKAQVASLPPTNEWTPFEMFFDEFEPDLELLAKLGYNFTLVFSSSKNGDKFEGAVGSTLYIDEVVVSFDKQDRVKKDENQ